MLPPASKIPLAVGLVAALSLAGCTALPDFDPHAAVGDPEQDALQRTLHATTACANAALADLEDVVDRLDAPSQDQVRPALEEAQRVLDDPYGSVSRLQFDLPCGADADPSQGAACPIRTDMTAAACDAAQALIDEALHAAKQAVGEALRALETPTPTLGDEVEEARKAVQDLYARIQEVADPPQVPDPAAIVDALNDAIVELEAALHRLATSDPAGLEQALEDVDETKRYVDAAVVALADCDRYRDPYGVNDACHAALVATHALWSQVEDDVQRAEADLRAVLDSDPIGNLVGQATDAARDALEAAVAQLQASLEALRDVLYDPLQALDQPTG